jgi:hypothetical protein
MGASSELPTDKSRTASHSAPTLLPFFVQLLERIAQLPVETSFGTYPK